MVTHDPETLSTLILIFPLVPKTQTLNTEQPIRLGSP